MQISYKLSKIFKVIDIFSGKILDGVYISCNKNVLFLNKGNGFYISQNLEKTTYEICFKCEAYETKNITFDITETDLDLEEQLVSLVPSNSDLIFLLKGKFLSDKNVSFQNISFYYTLCVMEYRKRIIVDGENGSNVLRIQIMEEELSLEGRKFAVENGADVYTLGKYNYVDNRHTVKNCLVEHIPVGKFAYLLFECSTNEAGEFSLTLPKYLIEEDKNKLFFYFTIDGISETSKIIDFDLSLDELSVLI